MRNGDHKPDRRQSPVAESGTRRPTADALAAAAQQAGRRGPPPVHLWNPPFCGDLDIRIARDGTWFYLRTPIGRRPLVKLFASDVRAEGEGPDQSLTFTTNVDDEAIGGPDNPIRLAIDPETGEPSPYVHIRRGLEALIDRKTFYRLVDLGTEHAVDAIPHFGIWSGGAFFPLLPSAELDRLSA